MTYEAAINMTGLIDMFQYANRVTNNTFVIMLLITVYIIPFIYLMMRNYKWTEASLVAGFFAAITAIFLRVTEITTVERYILFAIAAILIPLVVIFTKDETT